VLFLVGRKKNGEAATFNIAVGIVLYARACVQRILIPEELAAIVTLALSAGSQSAER
jgi:hypothetical protein